MTDSRIPAIVDGLRHTFGTGKTRPIEWRISQLNEIQRALREHEQDFAEALRQDLGKSRFESTLAETG